MAHVYIGVLADSHDNGWALAAILARFREEGVAMVLHAGDFVAPFNARHFRELGCPFVGVFGNNDGERIGLSKAFAEVGPIHLGPHPVTVHQRRLLVMHEPVALEALARSGEFDALIYGHTHAPDLRMVPHAAGDGQTLILNPGEAGGWLHGRATAVLLDVETMEAHTMEVPSHP